MVNSSPLKIAVLDLYDGSANMGMDCILEILDNWSNERSVEIQIPYLMLEQRMNSLASNSIFIFLLVDQDLQLIPMKHNGISIIAIG